MMRNETARRSSKIRSSRVAALSSTSAISLVTIAGSASGAVLFLTILSSVLGSNASAIRWLQPIMTAMGFSTVVASQPTPPTPTPTPSTVTVTEPALPDDTTGVGGVPKMKLGINLGGPSYYSGGREFANLTLNSGWWLGLPDGSTTSMPADRLDSDNNVKILASDEVATKMVTPPTKALQGQSVDINCTWMGKASLRILGTAKNTKIHPNKASFTFVPNGLVSARLLFSKMDLGNPVKNIDCREADMNPSVVFDPDFISYVSQYDTARFMKWQKAVENNKAVTWENRTKLTSATYSDSVDGAPIETMVSVANMAKVNPWFSMPWNANDEYIRNFAEYVRDNLDDNLIVYVEVSNEVWNWLYKVTAQARDEGRAENLSTSDGTALLYRYAERTGEVMDIWKSVFSTQPNRLVRVIATQNAVPWAARTVLGYKDTASKVDALATAPYFSWNFSAGEREIPSDFYSKILPDRMDFRLDNARENKEAAAAKGLRFIAYEAGQHILGADGEAMIPVLRQIQRDSRMGDLYTRYLTKWRGDIGDLMVLFSAWSTVNKYGAWGMQEYMGQPLSEAPKFRAVKLFQQSYLRKDQ